MHSSKKQKNSDYENVRQQHSYCTRRWVNSTKRNKGIKSKVEGSGAVGGGGGGLAPSNAARKEGSASAFCDSGASSAASKSTAWSLPPPSAAACRRVHSAAVPAPSVTFAPPFLFFFYRPGDTVGVQFSGGTKGKNQEKGKQGGEG